jgi:eukaryotic-like serine/threonine-protein kinase
VPAAAKPGPPTTTARPTTHAPTGSPTPGATPTVRQLTSSGGTVKATCPAPTTAQILSADPTSPFRVLSVDTAPGSSPTAVFKHGKVRVTMTVTCQAGVPTQTNSTSG